MGFILQELSVGMMPRPRKGGLSGLFLERIPTRLRGGSIAFILGKPSSEMEAIKDTLCLSIKFPIVFSASRTIISLLPFTFLPWEDFRNGLYLAGVECRDDAEAPEGWTKWVVPGYEYLCVEREADDTFSQAIKYLGEHHIPLVGAVHDFTDPQTGKSYMYFPVKRL